MTSRGVQTQLTEEGVRESREIARKVLGAMRGYASADETVLAERLAALAAVSVGSPEPAVMFRGPTTYTEACNCGSELKGWHRHDCGVFGVGSPETRETGE